MYREEELQSIQPPADDHDLWSLGSQYELMDENTNDSGLDKSVKFIESISDYEFIDKNILYHHYSNVKHNVKRALGLSNNEPLFYEKLMTLKNYITSMGLNEDSDEVIQQNVINAPFNIDNLKNIKSYSGRIYYVKQKLQLLGQGSSRMVFKLDNQKVIKVAKNKKGIGQNFLEAEIGRDSFYIGVVAEVFDFDKEFVWIISEYASKFNEAEFQNIEGYKFRTLGTFLTNVKYQLPEHESFEAGEEEKFLNNRSPNDLANKLRTIMDDYWMPVGDLVAKSSYGISTRKGKRAVILTDYGLDQNVYQSYYSKMKEEILREMDGVIDENKVIIDETHQSTKDIISLANEVIKLISRVNVDQINKDKEFRYLYGVTLDRIPNKEKYRELQDFITNAKLNIYFQPLIKGKEYKKGVYGTDSTDKYYKHSYKDLTVYFDDEKFKRDVDDDLSRYGSTDPTGLYLKLYYMVNTSLIHELQHAFDDYRSNAKVFNTKEYSEFKKLYYEKGEHLIDNNEEAIRKYLNLPHEIWARFSQAIADIRFVKHVYNDDWTEQIGKEMYPLKNIISEFKYSFSGYNVLTPEMQKKLLSKVVQFWNKEKEEAQIKESVDERKISYMPDSSTVNVKKNCQLAGNGDGTSDACNQGDINNLELKSINESTPDLEYRKWKRDNVTYRGISDTASQDEGNGGMAMLGSGLYSVPASNKSMARGYGKLYILVNAKPKNPKIVNTVNEWQIWFQQNVIFPISKAKGKKYPDARDVNSIKDEMLKLGYDGVIIKGREIVNYKPENVRYYSNEKQLEMYYDDFVAPKNNKTGMSESINEEIELFHGTTPENAKSITQNGFDSTKHQSGYINGLYTYRSIENILKFNKTFTSPYGAVVKLTLPSNVKKITIDQLEKYPIHDEFNGYSPIFSKTQSAKKDGYGLVIRGQEYIIINTDLISKVEDVSKLLDNKNITEKIDINLPNKELSGYKSFNIKDDGVIVGTVELVDRGNNYMVLDKIHINKEHRGKGYANGAMKLVLDYADRYNKIITLTPDSTWGSNKEKLRKWYQSLGFTMNKGKHKDFQTMQLMYKTPSNKNLQEGQDEKIEYGAVMLKFNLKNWTDITNMIHKEDIYDKPTFGLETEPHVTILYGLHDNVTTDQVNEKIKKDYNEKEIIKVKLLGISYFETPNYDVVKFDAESEILHTLNSNLKELPYTSEYPDYEPHMTISYVKKGTGKKYEKKLKDPIIISSKKIIYSTVNEKKYVINEVTNSENTMRKSLLVNFLTKIEDYQSNHYGNIDRDEIVNAWKMLPPKIKAYITPNPAELNQYYRGADGLSPKSAISFTGNKKIAALFGTFVIPFKELQGYEGLISTEKVLKLIDGFKMNFDIGDDEGEIIVLNPKWKKFNIEKYRYSSLSEDLVYGHVTDATQDEYKMGIEEGMTESISNIEQLPFKQEIESLGGKLFSVGGAVRDTFLGKESKDLDILITGVSFDQLEQLLSKYGRVDAVGKSFGVLKFKPQGSSEEIDIAIPRTEKSTGQGGHKGFEVASDHQLPIEKDLERRDFTINAIAKDIKGNIIDPYNGQEDLKNKIIRVVNPEAFSDDPLRMIRAVQFAARFGFIIEPNTMNLITTNAEKIKEIPAERILIELDKIIKKGDKRLGAQLLKDTGLFRHIFNFDIKQSTIDRSPFEEVKTMGEYVFLLTRLLSNPAEFYKTTLKGDIPTYKEISALTVGFTNASDDRIKNRVVVHNMYTISPESLNSKILPQNLETAVNELMTGKYPKGYKELAVTGNDLIEKGFSGKQLGDKLKELLLAVYSDKVRNEKEDLLNY